MQARPDTEAELPLETSKSYAFVVERGAYSQSGNDETGDALTARYGVRLYGRCETVRTVLEYE